ncbi:hypothetical protein [Streptomyces sp. NBC_01744]|uniref:hypothetical protein n=1 Tax=Streptomyces sp. NBC_01744 TaxID=2975927 RepID=UPI003D9A3FC6|nr:hypothetical protein OIE70_36220 [Streptomyces sp. NBC_01744]
MNAPDPFLVVANVVITAVVTAHVWGPGFLGLAVAVTWWRLRPTGRHRDGRTRRTTVRTAVRTPADTGPDPAANTALTCADMCPDVSTDTCPAVSGRDEEGER